MKCSKVSLLFVLIVVTALYAHATDRYVAQDNAAGAATPFLNWATAATNIQDAVDVSVDNDVIWIAPGTYSVPTNPGVYKGTTNIVHITTGLELRSSNGVPADTIIDGNGSFRGMYLYPPDAQRILVDGITVSNCVATNGAGIYIEPMNTRTAVVQNCVVEYNSATNEGGGIAILKAGQRSFDYMISNCVIRGNLSFNSGGGIADGGSRSIREGIITDCVIVSNVASRDGGGFGCIQQPTNSA